MLAHVYVYCYWICYYFIYIVLFILYMFYLFDYIIIMCSTSCQWLFSVQMLKFWKSVPVYKELALVFFSRCIFTSINCHLLLMVILNYTQNHYSKLLWSMLYSWCNTLDFTKLLPRNVSVTLSMVVTHADYYHWKRWLQLNFTREL